MAQHKVEYKKNKETKGAVRYESLQTIPGNVSVFGDIYFRKEVFEGKGYPTVITVTFNWEGDEWG
jgi:hypothetical protein